MWPYHPDLLETPVPRYTSYPTAADFGDLQPDLLATALGKAEGDISLYLHIPFCEKICFYCGCNTSFSGRKARLESYLAALHEEIAIVAAKLPRETRVSRISFGGGSPNAIAAEQFEALVSKLAEHFILADPDWSIELDPRTMTAEWAQVLRKTGITRASLGVQTFAQHCQEAIGRVQSEDLVLQTVDWLRAAGVTSLNFDLMYGLPGQSWDDLLDSLNRTRVLGADRIALFGYAHVPHIVPRQRVIDASNLPDQVQRFEMASRGFAYLCTHGYTPVGFDHFAKPGADPLARAAMNGTLHRNFQGFTDDSSDILIGLGSSAISSFPDLLIQNEKNSGRYRMLISQGKVPASRGIQRSAADRMHGQVIEDILCRGHAWLPSALIGQALQMLTPFVERGLASVDGEWLTITTDGLPYARTIAALFDTYRGQSATKFSSAV